VRRRPSAAARRRRRSRLFARGVIVAVLALLVGATTFVGGLLAAPFDERQVPPPPKAVLLLAADGTQIGSIRPVKKRVLVPPEAIPDVMREAIISAEDERFLEHNGVDPIGIGRAFLRDVTGGQQQGGSTLTQQYVKNVYVGNDRTLARKVKEAAIAVRLEDRKSKQEILTDYLNVLFLGNGTYGVQAASRYYFGVDVTDLAFDAGFGVDDPTLALARAAMLAGIAPAPSAWNPVRDWDAAKVRQRYTLNRMVAAGKITPEEAGAAFSRDMTVVQETPPPTETTAPEFSDLVEAQLREQYASEDDEDLLFRGGLRVTTTLDTALQEAVTTAARDVLPDADDPQAAVVAIDPRNGDVKAMTTLRRHPEKVDGNGVVTPAQDGYTRYGFNLATSAYRSTGSTLKPFTLATALMQGKSLGDRRRAPACDSIRNPGGEPNPYRYCNAGESGYRGSLTLRQALQKSVNTVYVPLANEVGRENVKNVLEAAGAQASPAFPIKTGNLSFGLGAGVEVTPMSLTGAFGTLVNSGVRVPPRVIAETRNEAGGVVTPAAEPQGTQAVPKEVADQVTEAMSGVTAGAGTAPRARQPFPVYGKTGTTNDSVDAWFIGCVKDPYHVCLGVWMGFEHQSCDGVSGRSCGGMQGVNGVRQVFGGTLPAEIFARSFDNLRAIEARRAAPPAAEQVATVEDEPAPAQTSAPRRTTAPEAEAPAPAPAEPAPAPVEQQQEPVEPPPPPPPPAEQPPPSPRPEPEPSRPPGGGIFPDPPG
jgi:penicillin-binding protein 1A